MVERFDFRIANLGEANIPSPIPFSRISGDNIANYATDEAKIVYRVDSEYVGAGASIPDSEYLEVAGPRSKIYFNPGHVHAAIVTCGGLCPGLNDVIRAVVRCLWYRYGVRLISGIRYGFKGFLPEYGYHVKPLDPDVVDDIHKIGGTVIGTSRGGSKISEIVDALQRMNINMLFTLGGDGTQRGALAITEEIERRKLKISVVGIPKTIDNDLSFIERSFGFETAVAHASRAVSGAHTEAHSAMNGIGLVKLMGRESGFIAVHTALAVNEANFVLIPEIRFDLEGPNGLLSHLKNRLLARHHAVIIVAEGAGQYLLNAGDEVDASGNRKLADIGVYLKDRIHEYFKRENMEINMKYIDPSYIIRSAPADPNDSVYCSRLGNNAVHAAMAGKTGVLIGLVNEHFVHLPIQAVVSRRNFVDPESSLWRDTVEATRQPSLMVNEQ